LSILNKRDTKKLVQPQIMTWTPPAGAPDWLDDSQKLYLSAVALLGVVAKDTKEFTRIELSEDGFTLSCGKTVGRENCEFKAKWRLWAMPATNGLILVTLPSFTTNDDALVDKKTIVRARDWLREALQTGVSVETAAGLPDFADWVTPLFLRSDFFHSDPVFGEDFVARIPNCFAHGARLTFPSDAREVLTDAFLESGARMTPMGESLAVLETSFWSDRHHSQLVLLASGGVVCIELSCPQLTELSLVGSQRLFRSTLRALRCLCDWLDTAPAAKSTVEGFLENCTAPSAAPDRADRLLPLWSNTVSAAVMPLSEGMRFPVGVMVSSEVQPAFEQFLAAERALLVRQRSWGVGLTRKARDANRHYGTRRPAVLQNSDGGATPFLRYVHMAESEADAVYSADYDKTWFWEARYTPLEADADGRHRALLLADGIATADGFVAYGTELLTLYRTWAGIMLAADPSARITTLYVRLPGLQTGPASGSARATHAPSAPPAAVKAPPTHATCKACSTALNPGARFCSACGADTARQVPVCPACGVELRSAARFCGGCGTAV